MNLGWTRAKRFERQYREHVLASLRYIDLKGLVVVGFHTPEFEDVFVDVGVAHQTPHNAPAGVLSRPPADERHAVTEFLGGPTPAVLALIGVPGSGKTTLLRHLALTISRSKGRRPVPILLYLRDHVDAITADPDVPLTELLRAKLGRYGEGEPPGWFERRLAEGACTILLDGLDEVARPDDRRLVADWVERQTRQYPGDDLVVTSRPHGYRAAPVAGARVLQVRSFTDEQVTRFVRGWYLAIEELSTRSTGDAVRLRAERSADELLDRLHANPNLYDLTANPLLLTMVANVHRFGSKLPDSRAELYREICEVMLWRRHEAKRLPVQLDGDKKEVLLRGLALAMMRRGVRDASRDAVLAEFRPALSRMATTLTEQALLEDVTSSGLLVERESGLHSFAHFTFQEYLAAAHIREKGLAHLLTDEVDNDWWRETTLLYVARADADPVVAVCLASGTVTALSLAFDCAERAAELAPRLRNRLDDVLDPTTDDPERRSLIAGVMLARHQQGAIKVRDGVFVSPKPITNALYALHDDHESNDEPVLGVDGADALRFAEWANALAGTYRLPRRSELDHPAVARVLAKPPLRSVWLDELELWVPPGAPHPHLITAATLAEHVLDDLKREPRTPLMAMHQLDPYRLPNQDYTLSPYEVFDLMRSLEGNYPIAIRGERAIGWADELWRLGKPAVAGATPMTAELAKTLRLDALLCAAEAEEAGIVEIAEEFRAIAAGVTLLERRADGRAPVNEAILLTADRRNG
ncbi:NACHT domain-containing protein [Saccharothrix luteola]|uniref:NACHT domain-containing protein n=1 Tax=Saccharothrix luteola TaxID=2893018 RepID=UPI001E50B5B6|nr:NACHT domain-containing protein [Saccharothrix luteola]MCC8245855.1 NACHT domain-containing protein [Saccharothrix luteola]